MTSALTGEIEVPGEFPGISGSSSGEMSAGVIFLGSILSLVWLSGRSVGCGSGTGSGRGSGCDSWRASGWDGNTGFSTTAEYYGLSLWSKFLNYILNHRTHWFEDSEADSVEIN
jgi:hypothetical protein